MIGESQRQGDDSQRGIGVAGCWKNRASCHEQVGQAVDLAVGIDYSEPRIDMHAGGPHVMAAAGQRSGPARFLGDRSVYPAQLCLLKRLVEEGMSSYHAPKLHRAQLPVQPDLPPPQRISLLRQRHPALSIGDRFGERPQREPIRRYEQSQRPLVPGLDDLVEVTADSDQMAAEIG